MPSTVVEIRCEYTEFEEIALLDAVQAELVEGFRIPADDKNACLVVHAPHRFLCPPRTKMPERFTVISIDAFSGGSVEAKHTLYRAMAERLEPLGIPKDHVTEIVYDLRVRAGASRAAGQHVISR